RDEVGTWIATSRAPYRVGGRRRIEALVMGMTPRPPRSTRRWCSGPHRGETMSIDPIQSLMSAYRGFHPNQDGDPDIISAEDLPFDQSSAVPAPATRRLVLVLVEHRLLDTIAGAGAALDTAQLLSRLERWKRTLALEGFASRFISLEVYRGDRHQD